MKWKVRKVRMRMRIRGENIYQVMNQVSQMLRNECDEEQKEAADRMDFAGRGVIDI